MVWNPSLLFLPLTGRSFSTCHSLPSLFFLYVLYSRSSVFQQIFLTSEHLPSLLTITRFTTSRQCPQSATFPSTPLISLLPAAFRYPLCILSQQLYCVLDQPTTSPSVYAIPSVSHLSISNSPPVPSYLASFTKHPQSTTLLCARPTHRQSPAFVTIPQSITFHPATFLSSLSVILHLPLNIHSQQPSFVFA